MCQLHESSNDKSTLRWLPARAQFCTKPRSQENVSIIHYGLWLYPITYSNLTEDNYTFFLDVYDEAGNMVTEQFFWTVDLQAPVVSSIELASPSPTAAASVDFTVTFSESMTGVDENDFVLATTGAISDASVVSVTGGPTAYTVTVNTGTGNGTIRLDLKASSTGIQDLVGNPISGGFTSGAVYTIVKAYYLFLPLTLR
jgi:hypothetical protein